MSQRNVFIHDTLQDVLRHEGRFDPTHTQGRLLVALARAALLGLPAPRTATGTVLEALRRGPCTSGALAGRCGLPVRTTHETLALLSRLNPSPVVVVDGAGASAVWSIANPAENEAA